MVQNDDLANESICTDIHCRNKITTHTINNTMWIDFTVVTVVACTSFGIQE